MLYNDLLLYCFISVVQYTYLFQSPIQILELLARPQELLSASGEPVKQQTRIIYTL